MQLSLKHPAEIISFLNALTGDQQTGEVLLQSRDQSAKVYLREGLVLWAFATGQDESFQSILVRDSFLSKEKLLEGIRGAREQGKKSLNDILIALRVDDPKYRQEIIERHTRAALRTLQTWENCQAQFNSINTPSDRSAPGLSLESLLEQSTQRTVRDSAPKPAPKVYPMKETVPATRTTKSVETKSEPAASLPELLERFRLEIPNFIAAMVIDGDTGMPVAAASDVEELDLEVVGAFFRGLSTSALSALSAMGKSSDSDCALEEILVTSVDEYAILRTLRNGAHLLYVSVDKTSNPGMVRIVIRKYLEELNGFLA